MSAQPTLEDRVAALEQQLGADQLTPGVFNLNATGGIEERLTGFLEALGIQLPEGPPSGEHLERSEERWVDAGGVIREFIRGQQIGTAHELLFSTNASEESSTTLELAAFPLSSLANLTCGGASALLLNSAGASSFLQVTGVEVKRRLALGTATFVWAVKGHSSGNLVINTGLTTVLGMAFFPATATAASISREGLAGGSVTAKAWTPLLEPNPEEGFAAQWIAIGT